VGAVRVVDRDIVEERNLPHQVLYTADDARRHLFKAEAAGERLRAVNPDCAVEPVVADYAPGNALRLASGADVIIDGADNLETKLLLNDVAVATATPLVHAGCAGTEGTVLAIVPGRTHCLRCLWPEATRSPLSCETRGVLPGAVAAVAAFQATEAMKVLLRLDELCGLVRLDVWTALTRRVPLPTYDPRGCPACGRHDLKYLRGEGQTSARLLCGGDTVLLSDPTTTDLDRLARRHRDNPSLRADPECVRLEVDGCRVVVFASGRTLVHGAGGEQRARAVHARHVTA
jgi:adenylyltransferase/sulfurtransferase